MLLDIPEAGGSGFVRRETAGRDLIAALEAALQGEVCPYPSGNKLLLGEFRLIISDVESKTASPLSADERRVLALAAEGFNSTEIEKKLFLSPRTVDSSSSRAMRKLGLGSRPDLVRSRYVASSSPRHSSPTIPHGRAALRGPWNSFVVAAAPSHNPAPPHSRFRTFPTVDRAPRAIVIHEGAGLRIFQAR
jgi:DNA-binding CsgD family transcriptional regulator